MARALTFALLLPATAAGQDTGARNAPRELLPLAHEVALARSAAPPATSADATVWVLGHDGYQVATSGTNGVHCYVGRSFPRSREPQCFDPEGAETVMRIQMRKVELRHGGMPEDDVEATVARAIADGELRLPSRPSLSFMMSEGQHLMGSADSPGSKWHPHVMVYYPYLTAEQLGLAGSQHMSALTFSEGTASSGIIMIVPEFIPVEPSEEASVRER